LEVELAGAWRGGLPDSRDERTYIKTTLVLDDIFERRNKNISRKGGGVTRSYEKYELNIQIVIGKNCLMCEARYYILLVLKDGRSIDKF
jgi:hypothetical protein